MPCSPIAAKGIRATTISPPIVRARTTSPALRSSAITGGKGSSTTAQRGALEPWFGSDIAAAIPDEPGESKSDLLQRIAAALTHSEERIDESGERTCRWRQLPLVDQGHIIPLFIGVAQQREQPESGGGRRRRPVAIFEFAVEVALAALGRTRIGAVYQQRRLDIVVQSEVPIAQDGRERIVTAVAAVFDEFGLGGSCRFEAYRDETAAAIKV